MNTTFQRSAAGNTGVKALKLFCCLAALGAQLLHPSALRAGTHTWTGASGDGKWSTAGNWSGGAPVAGEAAAVILSFPAAGSKRATNDIANLTIDQMQIAGDGYIIAGAGAGTNLTLRSQVLSSTFFISGANALLTNFSFVIATNATANASASVSSGDTATFRCRFTGPGGLVKRANGTLVLDGNAPNTYAGLTEIQGGTVQLSQSGVAIPGKLVIGYPAITNLAAVELLAPNQVGDTADVFVNYNGSFAPGVFSDTIGSITLSNADLVAGIGLTLQGDFTSIGTNLVTGTIRLGGADRTFDVTGRLAANCFLENPAGFAGIIKTGPGTMELLRTNSYNGTTVVNGGTLLVSHAGGLGTAAVGTQVNDGGTLEVSPNLSLPTESLFLIGNGASGQGALVLNAQSRWNGNVQLSTDAAIGVHGAGTNDGFILGQMTGAGTLYKIGAGRLWLQGGQPNSFNGAHVQQGELVLDKPIAVVAVTSTLRIGDGLSNNITARVSVAKDHQIADSTAVFIDSDGELNLCPAGCATDVIGSLTLRDGSISGAGGTLILKGDVTVAGGDVAGDFSRIDSALSLGGASRTFKIESGGSLSIYGPISDGGNGAGFTKTGQGGMTLGGRSTYAGPTVVTEGLLSLWQPAATFGSTNAGTFVYSNAEVRLQQGVSVTNESLTLDGLGAGSPRLSSLVSNVWAGPITVNTEADLEVGYSAKDSFEIRGSLNGAGSLTKYGSGILKLTGTADNTLAGRLTFAYGTLELRKTGGAVAVSGPFTLGSTFTADAAIARLYAHNQIDNGVTPRIERNGLLDLNGFNDSVGGLDLRGGDVATGGGLLTLLGDVETRQPFMGAPKESTISGILTLGNAVRTFNVGANGTPHALTVSAEIFDGGSPAGFKLIAPALPVTSVLTLSASNSFTGPVTVGAGTLEIRHSRALGSPASGTTVSNGATLALVGPVRVVGEPLTLAGEGVERHPSIRAGALRSTVIGTNSWSGPIQLNSPGGYTLVTVEDGQYSTNATLVLDGPISGDALLTIDTSGRLVLAGSQDNTYTGLTLFYRGELVLAKTNRIAIPDNLFCYYGNAILARNDQIQDLANVAVFEGTFQLKDHLETIGSLKGDGTVDTGTGTLRVGNTNGSVVTTFEGTIAGSGDTNFVKFGASRQIFAGTNTCTGSTLVLGGILEVNGRTVDTATFVHSNAVLSGTGTLGDLLVKGGTVSPGAGKLAPSYGSLRANGNVTFFPGSKLFIELGGTNAGVNQDQLVAAGNFNLSGGSLEIAAASGATATNDQCVIVRTLLNAPAGTFANLPEGGLVTAGPAKAFQITYAGGDGSDIALTQIAAAAAGQISGITLQPDGAIQLGGQGSPSVVYIVEANSDLNTTNWINIGTTTGDWNGSFQFVDTNAVHFPMRFYRFVIP